MISEQEYNRMCWASRRGMLELDLMLVPFVEHCFKQLSEQDQQHYITLLESEDNDLFAWLLGRGEPEDANMAAMIQMIKAQARKA